MPYLLLTAHLFLLLFWTRLWVKPAQEFYFNPFVSGPVRFIDSIIGFLRPALMLPDRLTALVLLLLFWAFQTIFFARFGGAPDMTFGEIILKTPIDEPLSWGMQFAHSGFRTAQFLLQLWTVYFFVRLIAAPNCESRAQEVFTFITNPFSRMHLLLQPFVLLPLHLALAYAVIRTGAFATVDISLNADTKTVQELFKDGPIWMQAARTGLLALISFTSALGSLLFTLVFFLFGGLITMLFRAQLPSMICRESTDLLMGRFARNSTAATTGLDLTPLFFIIVLNILAHHLQSVLSRLLLLQL